MKNIYIKEVRQTLVPVKQMHRNRMLNPKPTGHGTPVRWSIKPWWWLNTVHALLAE